jgi:hypothetical protein
MKKIAFIIVLATAINHCIAQGISDSLTIDPSVYFNKDMPIKANKDLRFIAYFFTQGVTSNYYPTNTFFQGQVIGRLFGRSTARTTDTTYTSFVEQRFLPFFLYTPKILDGKVTLRASFEIDWTWGDASYGAGGNQGAAFNADFVNIQTQNLEIEIIPTYGWAINIGLMRGFDTPYHPYRTTFDQLQQSGFRLMYWAGDMAGINVRKDFARGSIAAGIYNLWENKIELRDDVWLGKLIGNYKVNPKINLGGAVHYIDDKSSGAGGASILGQGPKSLLTEYTGAYRFNFPEEDYTTQIAWIGAFFNYNTEFIYGNHRISGFFNYNLGTIKGNDQTISKIRGFGANLRYGFRYGETADDEIAIDYIYTTGDNNGNTDGVYSGVITGNTWGAPGNLPISTGNSILFPSGNVVNRYMPLISDISNLGVGLNTATLQIKKGVIPNKLITALNGSFALSNAALARGGNTLGYELNAGVIWKIKTFLELELRGGHVWLGDFYDAPYANGDSFLPPDERLGVRPVNPWTVFAALKWLMF